MRSGQVPPLESRIPIRSDGWKRGTRLQVRRQGEHVLQLSDIDHDQTARSGILRRKNRRLSTIPARP